MHFNNTIDRRRSVVYYLASIGAAVTLLMIIIGATNNTIQQHHPVMEYWAQPQGFVATLLFFVLLAAAIAYGGREFSDHHEVRELIDKLYVLFDEHEVGSAPVRFTKAHNLIVTVKKDSADAYLITVVTSLNTQRELRVERYRVEDANTPGVLQPMSDLPYFRALVDFFTGYPAALIEQARDVEMRLIEDEMRRRARMRA